MNFFSSFLSEKNDTKLENALSDHKAFSKKMSDENKQKFKKSWNIFLEDFQTQYLRKLLKLSAKQRWYFAFSLLNDFNLIFPFDLLKDIVSDIPGIHDSTLDSDIIKIMLEDIEIARYEYGFTISELGELADLLAKNAELSLEQSSDVLKHVLEIELSNYSSSLDEFKRFLTYLDRVFEKINLK